MLGNALAHHAHRLHLVMAEIDSLARHGRFEERVLAAGASGGRVRLPQKAPRPRAAIGGEDDRSC